MPTKKRLLAKNYIFPKRKSLPRYSVQNNYNKIIMKPGSLKEHISQYCSPQVPMPTAKHDFLYKDGCT